MIPKLTISGLQLAGLLGGAVVLKAIFAWPSVGRVIYEAIIQRDYPMIQSGVLVLGVFVVLTNLVFDVAYRFLNPRVELNQRIDFSRKAAISVGEYPNSANTSSVSAPTSGGGLSAPVASPLTLKGVSV